MRLARLFVSVSLFLSQAPSPAPTAPQRDIQAVAILQQSVQAMGGSTPSDSVATGTAQVVAGSDSQQGSIRILTRGTDQSLEQFQSSSATRSVTYSRGAASETTNGATRRLSLERGATSQSLCFPLGILAGALANPDESFQYIGAESIGSQSAQHLRMRNTFASHSALQSLADFTVYDIWIDSATNLPVQISAVRREGGGSLPRIALDVYYSGYQVVAGIAYPVVIQQSLNGTPWMTITITNVQLNTGLTDADFAIAQGAK